MHKYKPTLLVDLDGVLNEYKVGFDENFIPPLRQDAENFLKRLRHKYSVKIFSSRDKHLVEKWVTQNHIEKLITGITNIKEPAYLIIDDRCLTFSGDYEQILLQLKDFKPWYKSAD